MTRGHVDKHQVAITRQLTSKMMLVHEKAKERGRKISLGPSRHVDCACGSAHENNDIERMPHDNEMNKCCNVLSRNTVYVLFFQLMCINTDCATIQHPNNTVQMSKTNKENGQHH